MVATPNLVVDTGSKGCCQAEEGVLSDHVGLWDSWTQLTGTKQAKQATQPGRSWRQKLRVWEEFGEAMEEDYRSAFEEILANRHPAPQKGEAVLCQHCLQCGWGAVDLTTQLGTLSDGGKKYFEDLLNPTDLPSNEEAEAGDSEVDLSIIQAERTFLSLPGKVYCQGTGEENSADSRPSDSGGNNAVFVPGHGTLDLALYPPCRVLGGFMGVCPTSPHVLCGSGEGIRPCPSKWYSVGVLRLISQTCSQYMLDSWQGCPLSLVLFIIFMDRISRRSQGPEGVRFGNHRISSLLFADDVVLLASSSSQDLQHVLERFAAECEAAGMRISTSKSEAMVLDRKRVAWRGPASSGGVQ
ncbi:hypothetical protein L3Q82_024470, partial [Scortum barcoo]